MNFCAAAKAAAVATAAAAAAAAADVTRCWFAVAVHLRYAPTGWRQGSRFGAVPPTRATVRGSVCEFVVRE